MSGSGICFHTFSKLQDSHKTDEQLVKHVRYGLSDFQRGPVINVNVIFNQSFSSLTVAFAIIWQIILVKSCHLISLHYF